MILLYALYATLGFFLTPTLVRYMSESAFGYMTGETECNGWEANVYVCLITITLLFWPIFIGVVALWYYDKPVKKEQQK